jgi:hypothetical protein
MNLLISLQKYAEQPLTTQLLLGLLKDYQRPYDKIDELEAKGYIVQLRKGLYLQGDALATPQPEPFLIANHLYGPSYVSLDSALSHYGFIPERVFDTTSVTSKLSKKITTPAGKYSYLHLPLPYYSFGIQPLHLTNKQAILIASPEKALCDKIISTAGLQLRSEKQTKAFLMDDLRIERDSLKQLNVEAIRSWIPDCPKKNSIENLIKTVEVL